MRGFQHEDEHMLRHNRVSSVDLLREYTMA